jgi:cytochrome b561
MLQRSKSGSEGPTMSKPQSAATRPAHYSAAMIAIHWTTVALMVAVVVIAWIIPRGQSDYKTTLLVLHRSFGVALLALTVLRLVVRHFSPPPEDDALVAWLEALAARVTHVLLYVILLAMPVSGFFYSTARGDAVSVLGLFEIPPLLPASETLRSAAWFVHTNGQLAVYVVIGLHAAAALFHLVVRRDGVMARMLPGARLTPPRQPAAAHPGAR